MPEDVQVDPSVLEPLAEIRQEEAALRGYLSRARQARGKVSEPVYRKVTDDYAGRLSKLEEQAERLSARAREEYDKVIAEYEALAGPAEEARLAVEELVLRNLAGEIDSDQLAERQRQPNAVIERSVARKEALDHLKSRFLSVLDLRDEEGAPTTIDEAITINEPHSQDAEPEGGQAGSPARTPATEGGEPASTGARSTSAPGGVGAAALPGAAPTAVPASSRAAATSERSAQDATTFVPLGFLTIEQGPGAPAECVLGDTTYIGRGEDCHLRIVHPTVSRHHAVVATRAGGFRVRDLGSQNGTLVNGEPATDRPLADGDEIRVGEAVIIFSHQRRQPSA